MLILHETYDHWSVAVVRVTVHYSFFPTFDFLKICCFLHWIQSVNLHFLLPYIIMDLPILVGQFRKIDLKTVFTYPLGAMPWSLADSFGLIWKTNKAQLTKILENNVPIAERHPNNASSIYDGMALLQRLKLTYRSTFRMVAEKVFFNSDKFEQQ